MARTDPRPLDDTSTTSPEWHQLQAAIETATNQEQNIPCIPTKSTRRNVDWMSDSPKDQARAAHWCQPCPARQQCKAWALATNQRYGTLGGLTSAQRKTEQRRQRQATAA